MIYRLLFALALLVTSSAGIATLPQLAGTNQLHSTGAGYLAVELAEDDALAALEMETQSENAVFYLVGPSIIFGIKAGDVWEHLSPGSSLRAGTYFAYLVSEDPMTVTMSLQHAGGSASFAASDSTPAGFMAMPLSGVLATLPQSAVSRYSGATPETERPSIVGFAYSRGGTVLQIDSMEFRWSNDDGILFCLPVSHQAVAAGEWDQWGGGAFWDMPPGEVRLDTFLASASPLSTFHITGFWIQRASADPVVPRTPRPPLTSTEKLSDELDYDVDCIMAGGGG
jgi:hypothetical protein